MSKQNVEDFQMITSASEAQARNYLARYNQNLERAIQGWYAMIVFADWNSVLSARLLIGQVRGR